MTWPPTYFKTMTNVSGQQPPYATVTVLDFTNANAKSAAVEGLEGLIDGATDLPGFLDCWVLDVGPSEAVMITLYASETAAAEASASVRPHLGTAIGAHVTGPPQRWAGPLVIGHGADSSKR